MQSKKSWYIFFIIVALIILSGVVFEAILSRTSFHALVLDCIDNSKEISSIKVIKYDSIEGLKLSGSEIDNRVTVTDKQMIDRMINNFSDIQLGRVNQVPKEEPTYWVLIFADDILTFLE